MRLRSFTAPNLSEAMARVRAEFGEDAIIVSTRPRGPGRGVQVTAAWEDDPLAPQASGTAGDGAAGDAVAGEAGHLPDPLDFDRAIEGALAQAPRRLDRAGMIAAAEGMARSLAWHGVPVRLNERLTLAAAAFGLDDPVAALAHALAGAFRFVPVPAAPARPVVLVGPQGVGKTLACAKLAARAVLSGIQVTVISADTKRAGGVAQLSAFIDLLRQTMVTVETPAELARAVESGLGRGPVLVDTAGINPFDPGEWQALGRMLEAAAGDPVLVLAAGGDPAEAAELGGLFAALGARQLIGTRLDSSRRYGALLAAAEEGRLRPANLSIHPYVSDGLRPAGADSMARLLLRDPENRDLEAAFGKAEQ